jgi:hypothetical protein
MLRMVGAFLNLIWVQKRTLAVIAGPCREAGYQPVTNVVIDTLHLWPWLLAQRGPIGKVDCTVHRVRNTFKVSPNA